MDPRGWSTGIPAGDDGMGGGPPKRPSAPRAVEIRIAAWYRDIDRRRPIAEARGLGVRDAYLWARSGES